MAQPLLDDQAEWEDDDENYENYDEDGEGDEDDDADAEAEEIARRLRDQLWADINAARANANAAPAPTNISIPPSDNVVTTPIVTSQLSSKKKEDSALATMKAILIFAEKDNFVRTTLAAAIIPDSNGDNVLDLLTRSTTSGTIPKTIAKPLSHLLVSLARSDALFSTLRHSNAPALQLDKGKRKRGDVSDPPHQEDEPASKKPFYGHPDLLTQVTDAVRIVTQTLSVHTASSRPLDPALVASIQLQLHQIFLFSVTSSAGGGADMNALQEISGLIQVIGVLSGIQIGPTPDTNDQTGDVSPNETVLPSTPLTQTSAQAISAVQIGDIGTAVYPCPTCRKIFSRLYSLRNHQRVHGLDRSLKCTTCAATFVRAHDLKRHAKLHEKTTWKCTGCGKSFSRRDAITRHKNSSRNRGPEGEACINGDVLEVALDEGMEKSVRERLSKVGGDAIASQTSGFTEYGATMEEGPLEEGEVRTDVIARVQSVVTSLHGLLSTHVATTLGAPSGSDPASVPVDPTAGQATLASVIARAQSQNLPLRQREAASAAPQPGEHELPDINLDQTDSGPVPHQNATVQDESLQVRDLEQPTSAAIPSLSLYGLSNDQALMLERAIADAASAAQAQAEAEAALEEEEEYDDEPEDVQEDTIGEQ